MKLFLISTFFLLTTCAFSQKPFVGKLVYSVEIADTSLREYFPVSRMVIFTNDTLIRVETSTEALGKQVLIQHITKKKAYLLIETPTGKYAVQIPEKEEAKEKKYSFKTTKGEKTIGGLKSKKLIVSNASVKEELDFFFHTKISAKYLPGFEDFPGLLTDYYVVSTDGLYHHQLIETSTELPEKDLFGIPSDYIRLSMSDFVDLMTAGSENEEITD